MWMLYLKKLLGSMIKSLQSRLWREFQFGNPKVRLIHWADFPTFISSKNTKKLAFEVTIDRKQQHGNVEF